MNCRRMERLLSKQRDGLLSAREARIVAAHLDGCPACRRRQAAFGAIASDLRPLAELAPSTPLARRALARWSAEQPPRLPRVHRRLAIQAAALAMAAVLLIALCRTGRIQRKNGAAPVGEQTGSEGREPRIIYGSGNRPGSSWKRILSTTGESFNIHITRP